MEGSRITVPKWWRTAISGIRNPSSSPLKTVTGFSSYNGVQNKERKKVGMQEVHKCEALSGGTVHRVTASAVYRHGMWNCNGGATIRHRKCPKWWQSGHTSLTGHSSHHLQPQIIPRLAVNFRVRQSSHKPVTAPRLVRVKPNFRSVCRLKETPHRAPCMLRDDWDSM